MRSLDARCKKLSFLRENKNHFNYLLSPLQTADNGDNSFYCKTMTFFLGFPTTEYLLTSECISPHRTHTLYKYLGSGVPRAQPRGEGSSSLPHFSLLIPVRRKIEQSFPLLFYFYKCCYAKIIIKNQVTVVIMSSERFL